MIVLLNTNILPIVNVGMYESLLSPSNVFNDWLTPEISEALDTDEISYCESASYEHFNSEAYNKIVAKYATELVADFFQKINGVIHVTLHDKADIYSPKEYNFKTDELDFEIEINDVEIQKIKSFVRGNVSFANWLKETYKSYSGFICFMPSTEEAFFKDIEGKEIERALSAYFTFLLRTHLGQLPDDEFGSDYILYERISSNHGIEEFVTDERFHEIMSRVHDARRPS